MISLVCCCAVVVVGLLGWRLRPMPTARGSVRRRGIRRWLQITTICISDVRFPATRPRRGDRSDQLASVDPRVDALQRLHGPLRPTSPTCSICWCCRSAPGISRRRPSSRSLRILPTTLRPSFTAVRQAMNAGRPIRRCTPSTARGLGPIAQPLVDSLSAADRYGLPLAPVLERLSFEARQQRRRDTEAAARELPVRLAMPLVLCTLPSFVLLGHRSLAPRSPVVAAHLTATEAIAYVERSSP